MWLAEYGPMLHLDTERFENYLKVAAKQVYRKSIKRKEGMTAIMTDKVWLTIETWITLFVNLLLEFHRDL